jgi:hypothetical protein
MRKLVPEGEREIVGSPFDGVVGDIRQMNIDIGTKVVVDENCWMHAWKGTRDVSSEVLSGEISASGTMFRTKVILNEKAARYRYTFRVYVNGEYIIYYFYRVVERESGSK